MEYLIYEKSVNKTELTKMNIVITDDCCVKSGVKIWSNVCIKNGSKIDENCEITSNSVLQNVVIGKGAVVKSSYLEDSEICACCTIGPFAHIRDNSIVGANCRIGNFVEIKNGKVGGECKIAHLAYVGDAVIGKNCNIGCGVIFCNYNGKIKQQTILGDNVFVGSNTNLIAPVKIGNNVYIAGGSTITQDINDNEFAIARSRQTNKIDFKNPYVDKNWVLFKIKAI